MTIAPAIFDGHVFALHRVREPDAKAAPDGLNDPLLKNPSASAAPAPRRRASRACDEVAPRHG